MGSFKKFMTQTQNEGSLKDLLEPVPQSQKWHKEGNVFKHTQLVRGGLKLAVDIMKDAAANPNSAFSDLNMNLNQGDINLLRLGGWLHDIGKRSATTVRDRFDPWLAYQKYNEPVPTDAPIAAHDHEKEKHFEPMMQQLGRPWHDMHNQADPADKQDLWFLIRNHMSLRNGQWSRRLWSQLIDDNGKYKNDRKVKLLLVLVLMDKMGRYGDASPQFGFANGLEALKAMQFTADMIVAEKEKQARHHQTIEFSGPDEFVAYLKSKGVNPKAIKANVKNKYGIDYDIS